jgi:hypothetical protein
MIRHRRRKAEAGRKAGTTPPAIILATVSRYIKTSPYPFKTATVSPYIKLSPSLSRQQEVAEMLYNLLLKICDLSSTSNRVLF